jgi:hypothetical protein
MSLFPLGGIPVQEYDATYVVTPTSRQGHSSDTVLASVEMLVQNVTGDTIDFPFLVLSTDPGTGARAAHSVEPNVINGSEPTHIEEVDEEQAAELARQRAAQAGADPMLQEQVRAWAKTALASAERIRRGRTRIKAGATRRIVVQQRLRVQQGEDGFYRFVTIAPSPLLTVNTRGRVSVYALMPFEDEDVHVEVSTDSANTETGYSFELGRIKQRQIVSWFWQNDPVLRLGYRYI